MASCPECGGVVEDNACTSCGTSVWPAAAADDTPEAAEAPPSPPASGTGSDGSASSSLFVNPPEATSPPPPPSPSTPPPPPPTDGQWQPSAATTSPGGASSGSSRKVVWWVLGGIAALAVLGVLAVFLLLRGSGLSLGELDGVGEGSAERLFQLRASCDGGDMQACDDLYLESPFNSDDEAFGDTCGGRNEPGGWCVDIHGPTAPPN